VPCRIGHRAVGRDRNDANTAAGDVRELLRKDTRAVVNESESFGLEIDMTPDGRAAVGA